MLVILFLELQEARKAFVDAPVFRCIRDIIVLERLRDQAFSTLSLKNKMLIYSFNSGGYHG